MSKGGVREGAGRKKMTDTVPVCWRISPQANEWIRKQAFEQGVTIARIVDDLIKKSTVVTIRAEDIVPPCPAIDKPQAVY